MDVLARRWGVPVVRVGLPEPVTWQVATMRMPVRAGGSCPLNRESEMERLAAALRAEARPA